VPPLNDTRLSPTLALVRLALLRKTGAEPQGLESLVRGVQGSAVESAAENRWREASLKSLQEAGGLWAEAGQKVAAL
jgi:hypothetical protein